MNWPFTVIIPARYASTRLPGKALLDIAGTPMVVHCALRARASGAARVVVATDHADIAAAVAAAGFEAVMTDTSHISGTDRLAEAVMTLGLAAEDIVVNVQGDEPLIDPAVIVTVADLLRTDTGAVMATACHAIEDVAALHNPAVVKVVLDARQRALYFSRAAIPWPRDQRARGDNGLPRDLLAYHHVGLYAYRAEFLLRFRELAPSPLETCEALEQLRVLWYGYAIAVAVTPHAPVGGVDTEEDLVRVRHLMGNTAVDLTAGGVSR